MVHFVFHEPRIAGNTGNAIRLAAVTGAKLHLIKPFGFDLEDAKLRRAGLDYHDLAEVTMHENFDAFAATVPHSRIFAFTARTTIRHVDISYREDDVLLFGCEPTGLPQDILGHPRISSHVRIPMLPARRSLNLANSASIAVYEAWRQLDFAGGE